MEETLSKDELLELLPKGIAYHNRDLSREERNLVETYLKKGEIKVICATNILAMGISLPFKNVIISLDKIHNGEEDEGTCTLVDYPSCKKILLLFDWIKGNKEMKSLEQEYFLYEGDVLRLAEGFCWLADSLAAIAESGCWKKKRTGYFFNLKSCLSPFNSFIFYANSSLKYL
ncbi:MAG: hypothetical protein KAH35_03735 [Candidatus Atribacteria bacterium]|nr:hypothetical protein [Candidatus Atribacteria bacterium]